MTNSLPESAHTQATDIRPFPWRVSISFGKSSSANFNRALYLAQSAPEYTESNGVYQATYSADPEQFLSFVKLYELVSGWKSAHVMIGGHLVDRKIIGNINYCYGDRCRSGNPDFCFGASYFTKNPFGCHRLQMNACNDPWVEFYGRLDTGEYMLNKCQMKRRIDYQGRNYKNYCPAFNYDAIIARLNELPSVVSEQEYLRLMEQHSHPGRITLTIKF